MKNCRNICMFCSELGHTESLCSLLKNCKIVKENARDLARLSLPNNLELQNNDDSKGIFSKVVLNRGVRFGPFIADCSKKHYSEKFPLKIFDEGGTVLYSLDNTKEDGCNWMYFVRPASTSFEQNVVCYQLEFDIYFSVLKTISIGSELRVWYAPVYAEKLGMPLLTNSSNFEVSECYPEKCQRKNNVRNNPADYDLCTDTATSVLHVKGAVTGDLVLSVDSFNCDTVTLNYSVEPVPPANGINSTIDRRNDADPTQLAIEFENSNNCVINYALGNGNGIMQRRKKRRKNSGNFICATCEKVYKTKDWLRDHILTHNEVKVSCEICRKQLSGYKSYYRHKRNHEVSKELQCAMCSAAFNLKWSLSRHIKSCHGLKKPRANNVSVKRKRCIPINSEVKNSQCLTDDM